MLGDLFDRVRTTIGASIWSLGAGLNDVFSYSVGSGGLLALTIINHSDSVPCGSLSAGSFVTVSPPVPEPKAWLLLLLLLLLAGAGIVGFTAGKRQQYASLAPS